jgi:hypothetical protein
MQLCDGSLATGVKGIGCGYNHSLIVLAINSEVPSVVRMPCTRPHDAPAPQTGSTHPSPTLTNNPTNLIHPMQ